MKRTRAGSGFSNKSSYFSHVTKLNTPRSTFDRSHKVMTTINSGYIVPFIVDEILPADSVRLRVNTFGRLITQKVPTMDNLYITLFFFFVPMRLVWDNWKQFFGERTPSQYADNDRVIPWIDLSDTDDPGVAEELLGIGSLWDFMGLPAPLPGYATQPANMPLSRVNALPFRGHNMIQRDWFRDQNLSLEQEVPTDDGPDLLAYYRVWRRRKRYDYFTSCLPWPQKGDNVLIPGFGIPLPIQGYSEDGLNDTSLSIQRVPNAAAWALYRAGSQTLESNTAVDLNNQGAGLLTKPGVSNLSMDPAGGLVVPPQFMNLGGTPDLNPATISSLRTAFQVQKYFERNARSGTRYVEILDSRYGVSLADLSYRPEFLGSETTRLATQPVAQTAPTDPGTTPQANLAAFSTFSHSNAGITKSFNEHGYLYGYICVWQDQSYQNGVEKMWSRRELFDFHAPEFNHLSEQPVWNYELQMPLVLSNIFIWGWQERYGEYRWKVNKITGKFRSSAAGSLDSWHLAQDLEDPAYYPTYPELGQDFIEERPPVERIVSVTNEPQFYIDMALDLKHTRAMPVYSVPGMADHF